MQNCDFCPHACHADRHSGRLGYCCSDDGFNISSICLHKGEEPVISGEKGICNVFFSRCNMQCVYCQNHQISRHGTGVQEKKYSLEEAVDAIEALLSDGCRHVGFVSPSHMIPQMLQIIAAIKKRGLQAIFVYNSNAYDSVITLKILEGIIDIYLPDFKYMEDETALEYSGVKNYTFHATAAIREMFRQKGSTLVLDEHGMAVSGLIIRHLVLPGQTENSRKVLKYIAEEISNRVHISLMSQYYPTPAVQFHEKLSRRITAEEYHSVCDEMERLGLYRGWVQELESYDTYRPDFGQRHPFEPEP